MALAAVLAALKGRGRPQSLKQFHTDIAWHAKVAVSLPSGYAVGVVDSWASWDGEDEVTNRVSGTPPPSLE
ncbi:Hypothetical protein FKW44_003204 [Caligus rogercresseyi]|uniref:Uncharacterized protein n=1 Tax=Caligus rogercresseyi TaxID=217165 RepID=A0A7T8KL92_CALRO|nr:Hypothetical protein FKW44_003204 [Caligus rogercresseyi]